jgi:hypothetical protein
VRDFVLPQIRKSRIWSKTAISKENTHQMIAFIEKSNQEKGI